MVYPVQGRCSDRLTTPYPKSIGNS